MEKKEPNKDVLPQDPLERCHLRWHCLFWGVWKAVCKRDKNLRWGLLETLRKYGFNLLEGSVPEQDPFKANPSDKVLRNALSFREGATIPILRGRKVVWMKSFFCEFWEMKHIMNKIALVLLGVIVASCSGGPPPIMTYYGARVRYSDLKHPGIDYRMVAGEPVIAGSDGYVSGITWDHKSTASGQNAVVIRHWGYDAHYAHLEDVFVRYGDLVKRGQLVGTISFRAEPTPHLHFGLAQFDSNSMVYSNTFDPDKFWLGGKPQCFDPEKDYPNTDSKWQTLPVPCGEYKNTLMRELSKMKK
jgi:hypothetical protein